MIQPNLKRLRHATEEILASLKPEDCPNEAINWADLHCVEAVLIVNDDGYEYMEVYIEEAAPECSRLREIIEERLTLAEWKNVTAVTEW